MSSARAGHPCLAVSRGEPFMQVHTRISSDRVLGAGAFRAGWHRHVNVLSLSIRARIVVLASLACLVPQLTSVAHASKQDAGAVRVSVSVPLHHKSHLAEGARASLPDGVLDRLLTAPFAPAALADLGISTISVATAASGQAEASANAPVILPPSRGPPALS